MGSHCNTNEERHLKRMDDPYSNEQSMYSEVIRFRKSKEQGSASGKPATPDADREEKAWGQKCCRWVSHCTASPLSLHLGPWKSHCYVGPCACKMPVPVPGSAARRGQALAWVCDVSPLQTRTAVWLSRRVWGSGFGVYGKDLPRLHS